MAATAQRKRSMTDVNNDSSVDGAATAIIDSMAVSPTFDRIDVAAQSPQRGSGGGGKMIYGIYTNDSSDDNVIRLSISGPVCDDSNDDSDDDEENDFDADSIEMDNGTNGIIDMDDVFDFSSCDLSDSDGETARKVANTSITNLNNYESHNGGDEVVIDESRSVGDAINNNAVDISSIGEVEESRISELGEVQCDVPTAAAATTETNDVVVDKDNNEAPNDKPRDNDDVDTALTSVDTMEVVALLDAMDVDVDVDGDVSTAATVDSPNASVTDTDGGDAAAHASEQPNNSSNSIDDSSGHDDGILQFLCSEKVGCFILLL